MWSQHFLSIHKVKMLLVLSLMDLYMVIPLLEYKAGKYVIDVVCCGSGYAHTTSGLYAR